MEKRTIYFSNIRAIACMAIVLLHTCSLAVSSFEPTQTERMWSYIIRNCLLWAVPCFVMVTGALLLDPQKEIGFAKIWKYIRRILAALLLFSFIFAVFDTVLTPHRRVDLEMLRSWVEKVLTNGSWLHMWYLYLVLALYLMLPIERLISAHASKKELRYLLLLYFVFLSIVPTVNTLTGKNIGFYITAYTVYPFYLFLGYAIEKKFVRFSPAAAWLCLECSTVTLILLTWAAFNWHSEKIGSLCGSYAFAGVAVQAAALFAVMKQREEKWIQWREIKQWNQKENPLLKILLKIDSCSFGIYLIHVLVIQIIYKCMKFDPYNNGGVLMLFGVFAVSFLVSWGVVRVLKLVPGLKKIV
ncbi:MAG: acyltransferase [Eubacteriales bacterium]|nr:acyltransferase [Eubacteriales bacterium]